MSNNMIIIGDISGQYDALMRLLKKCPDYLPVSVGDMIDRGPDSKKVLEFFMQHGKALMGNHEHMMLDYGVCKFYKWNVWEENMGSETLKSFSVPSDIPFSARRKRIPDTVWEYLASLPYVMEVDGALITHAPIHPNYTLAECIDFVKIPLIHESDAIRAEKSILWNRYFPRPIEGKYQIFGHNHYHGFLSSSADDDSLEDHEYGVCIDNTGRKQVMAMIWPTKEIVAEGF